MNVKPALTQLAADKRTLESKIRELIAKEVADFQMVTGVAVEIIDVRTQETPLLGQSRNYIVSSVTVGLALG